MMISFCVAHKRPTYPIPNDVNFVWLGSSPIETNGNHHTTRIVDISEEYDAWHPFLSGAAGSFGIERMLLSDMVPWDFSYSINIIQYRKFIIPKPFNNIKPNEQNLYVVNNHQIDSLNLYQEYKKTTSPYLLASPFEVGNIYLQYDLHHKIQDLLRYTAIAIDMGVISGKESYDFLNDRFLIQGGIEFGIYPIATFLQIVEKIRLVSMEFLRHHNPVAMGVEDRRAIAFCNERLGSYLLFKHLLDEYHNAIPDEIFGYMHYSL